MAHIRIGDEHFNVAIDGPREAPVLMMSNSLGADLRMWDPQMPELTKHFRVVRYDSRGHGASPADEGPYSIEKLGKDALAILDKLGVDKAHWVGLSKGGMVGQWLLANAPNRIARAVLANTFAFMNAGDLWTNRAKAARENGMLSLVDGTLDRWFTKDFRESHPEIMDKIGAMIANTPAHGYAACCLAIRDMDQRDALRGIRKPVLLIVGEHDAAAPPSAGEEIALAIPGARVLSLNAAHLSNIEEADAFTSAVIDFLSGRIVGEAPNITETAESEPAPPSSSKPAPKPASKPKATVETPATAPQPANDPGQPKIAPVSVTPRRASPVRKSAARKSVATKTVARKAARKAASKTATRKAAVKKSASKKTPAKKTAAKKTAAKKAATKKGARKAVAKKSARKLAGRKAVGKKSAARKSAAKKASVKKAVAKKSTGRKSATKKLAAKKRRAR